MDNQQDKAYGQAAARLDNPELNETSAGCGVADAAAEPASSHATTAVHAMALPPALRTENERMQGEGCTVSKLTGHGQHRSILLLAYTHQISLPLLTGHNCWHTHCSSVWSGTTALSHCIGVHTSTYM